MHSSYHYLPLLLYTAWNQRIRPTMTVQLISTHAAQIFTACNSLITNSPISLHFLIISSVFGGFAFHRILLQVSETSRNTGIVPDHGKLLALIVQEGLGIHHYLRHS